ncbi:MAG: S9 family peptidase [Pseudomonadota bacterium]
MSTGPEIAPPVAPVHPSIFTEHGRTRIDDYYWLRDDSRSDPAVLDLIAAENAYTRAVMAPTEALQNRLFNEITTRLVEEDKTVPVRRGDYFYHREFRAGFEHPVYLRRGLDAGSPAEVLLDVNELAADSNYYAIDNWSVSSGDDILAFAEDRVSRREYTIRFRNLETGEYLADAIPGVESDIAWAQDNQTLFYVAKDPQTLLPYRVYRHRLGTDLKDDVLVYEEQDPAFYTSVYKSRSNRFIVVSVQSTDSTEVQLIDAHNPSASPLPFLVRAPQHEYRIRHVPGSFFVVTNLDAPNYRVMQVPENALNDRAAWTEVVPHQPDVLIEDFEVFERFLVLLEREAGLSRIRVIDRKDGVSRQISFPDPAYTARLHANPDASATVLRYGYSSLVTPQSVFEYDMIADKSRLLKQDVVPGGYDPSKYLTERRFFSVRDGTPVPVTLVFRKDLRKPYENPLYLTGYGAYGLPTQPYFSSLKLSLLDRGFVYGIAHIRGGDEMGRAWYEAGRLERKWNTFNDFIDVTRALVEAGYAAPDKVFASGASAGGLLMGVIANEAPQLYRGIVAEVPFVDVITTMADPTIPLTTGEYSEWGNPADRNQYEYMLTYSPYDQVAARDYPHMLVTTGLFDSQVQYFEPLKWVSKLRRMKTDDNLLLLQVDMDTGHGGPSGRYERYRAEALQYAFILHLLEEP